MQHIIGDKMQEILNKEDFRNRFHDIVIQKMVWGHPLNNQDREMRKQWIEMYNVNIDVLKWYTNKNVLFEIVKYLGNRELCLHKKIRWLMCMKIDFLLYNFRFYKVFEDLKTLYTGLLDFSERERPPYAPSEKKHWQDTVWTAPVNPQYIQKAVGYSFAIDLDSDTFMECYEDAKKLFLYFQKFNIKFSVWCSGVRGFHFIIPFSEFRDLIKPFAVNNCVEFCHALALDLKDNLKLKKIDEVIYSASRYLKTPFSLDARNMRVVYPLDAEEFLNFKEEYMSMNYCLSQSNLGYRGVYANRESNPTGFKKMVEDL